MRPLWVVIIVGVLVMGLCSGNLVFAADRGGGHSGGYHLGGGHYGGHYSGGYYRGHSGSRFGVVIGSPFWDPWYYPYYPYYSYYPYYYPYYSPQVAEPSTPQEYIQRSQDKPSYDPSTLAEDVWYYCPKSRAYYPYVKKCPGGWQIVPAQPPSEEER